jgi:hypothetical protein
MQCIGYTVTGNGDTVASWAGDDVGYGLQMQVCKTETRIMLVWMRWWWQESGPVTGVRMRGGWCAGASARR